jgi:predicted alpha/beta hydrolase
LSAYRRGRGSFNPKTVVADKKRWIAMPFSSMFSSSVPDELDAAECLQKMRSVPIVFLHNPADPLAPYSAAQNLYDSYSGPKTFVVTNPAPSADAHYGSVTDPAAPAKILEFLRSHLAS